MKARVSRQGLKVTASELTEAFRHLGFHPSIFHVAMISRWVALERHMVRAPTSAGSGAYRRICATRAFTRKCSLSTVSSGTRATGVRRCRSRELR